MKEEIKKLWNDLFKAYPEATDFHWSEEGALVVREYGTLHTADHFLSPSFEAWIGSILKKSGCLEQGSVNAFDGSVSVGNERLRLHIYLAMGKKQMAARRLPSLENLPPDPDEAFLSKLSMTPSGLILLTGATGSGKSTAMAHLIEEINHKRSCHIVTLEAPAEYLFTSKQALIHQREIGKDVVSFAAGIRDALREDPDVIAVGELRDEETMAAALTAAETGHLVIGTLHAGRAMQAVGRICHAFPAEKEEEIRSELAAVLQCVAAQKLCHIGKKTILLREILVNTPAVAHLIQEKKEEQLSSYMETGRSHMRTFRQAMEQARLSFPVQKESEYDLATRVAEESL